jgi:hypothetical protein
MAEITITIDPDLAYTLMHDLADMAWRQDNASRIWLKNDGATPNDAVCLELKATAVMYRGIIKQIKEQSSVIMAPPVEPAAP